MTTDQLITTVSRLSNHVIAELMKQPVAATILPEIAPSPFQFTYGTPVLTTLGFCGWCVNGAVKHGNVGYSVLVAHVMQDGTWVQTETRRWVWASEMAGEVY